MRLQTSESVRLLPIRDFFTGYRKTALSPSEIVVSLFVPFTRKGEYTRSFKQAKRRDDDIAIVNAAFKVLLGDNGIIEEACLVFGGMAATTLM